METKEHFLFRSELLSNSVYPDGTGYADSLLLDNVLSDLLEAKLIDSEDINNCFYSANLDGLSLKVDAYCINETGERLQLFLINEEATSQFVGEEDLLISTQLRYQEIFNRTYNFLRKAMKKHLDVQDSDPSYFLIEQLKSSNFINQIDTVEIFLISPTLSVNIKNNKINGLKKIRIKDSEINTSYIDSKKIKQEKNILVSFTLIDLNFLYNLSLSKGNEYALEVDFEEVFGNPIQVLKAAETKDFESYLCVLPASGISSLYRRYSTRLLEKNVRSFLQFRGVNGGMRKTIRETPEKFIAYNNGLTITATNRDIVSAEGKLYLKSLTDFQIVNGGQTTASLFFSNKDKLDISEINLMAKINIAKNLKDEDLNTLISNISLYSNSQSKVSRVDLRSRDPKMDRIKKLSDTVLTPMGTKWFFEKSKGEFSTRKRLRGARIDKDYPRKVRLSKTDIGKYHTAWGDQPWLVKKGGEKVFRTFMENINGEGGNNKEIEIDRIFYEELIAKTILFRELEILHGVRNNAIGQLRAAVVPYTIAVLYNMFGGTEKREAKFNLEKLWRKQGLDDTLKVFLKSLMELLYLLIEKYKFSTDISENTKKKELWEAIKKSKEIKNFITTNNALQIIKNYSVIKKKNKKAKEVDFGLLNDVVDLYSRTKTYYSKLEVCLIKYNVNCEEPISYSQKLYTLYVDELFAKQNISERGINFFNNLFMKINKVNKSIFNEIKVEQDLSIVIALDKIMAIYGNSISENKDILTVFKFHERIANNRGHKFTSSLNQIGHSLALGESPKLKHIILISSYFNS